MEKNHTIHSSKAKWFVFAFTIIAIVLLMAMFAPSSARAASTVSIGSVSVSPGTSSLPMGGGVVSFSNDGNFLTLSGYSGAGHIIINGDITIILEGDNTIDCTSLPASIDAIDCTGNLTIVSSDGTGSLTIKGALNGIKTTGSLTIGDGTNNLPIDIAITNSATTATGEIAGISSGGDVTIKKAADITVSAESTRTSITNVWKIFGISAPSGKLTIEQGAACKVSKVAGKVDAAAGDLVYGAQVQTAEINGDLQIQNATGRRVYGLLAAGNININDGADVSISNFSAAPKSSATTLRQDTTCAAIISATTIDTNTLGLTTNTGGAISIAENATVNIKNLRLSGTPNVNNFVAGIFGYAEAGNGKIDIKGDVTIDDLYSDSCSYGIFSRNCNIDIPGELAVTNIDAKIITYGVGIKGGTTSAPITISGTVTITDKGLHEGKESADGLFASGGVTLDGATVTIDMTADSTVGGIWADGETAPIIIKNDSTVKIKTTQDWQAATAPTTTAAYSFGLGTWAGPMSIENSTVEIDVLAYRMGVGMWIRNTNVNWGVADITIDDSDVDTKVLVNGPTTITTQAVGCYTIGFTKIKDATMAISATDENGALGIAIYSGSATSGGVDIADSEVSSIGSHFGIRSRAKIALNGGWFEAWGKQGNALIAEQDFELDSAHAYKEGSHPTTAARVFGDFTLLDSASAPTSHHEYVSLASKYTLTYHPGLVDGITPSGEVPLCAAEYWDGDKVVISDNIGGATGTCLSVDGYKFVGWCSSPDGSDTVYCADEMLTIDCDTILYAIWAPQEIIEPEPSPSPTPSVSVPPTPSSTASAPTTAPPTGDESNLYFWILGAILSLGVLCVLFAKKRSSQK